MRTSDRRLALLGLASLGLVLGLAGWIVGSSPDEPGFEKAHPPGELAVVASPAPAAIPLMRATTAAEVRTVVKFCRSASGESVPSLRTAALESPDPLVAGNALRALGRLGAVVGDPDLESLVSDERPRLRQEAVIALGRSRSVAAVERLATLVDDAEPALRPFVLQALANLGGERSRAILRAALADARSTETERTIARAALEQG